LKAARVFFGEGCLAGQPQRMATVTTMTDCTIMRLEIGGLGRERAGNVRIKKSEYRNGE
jgi:hypothetical protein